MSGAGAGMGTSARMQVIPPTIYALGEIRDPFVVARFHLNEEARIRVRAIPCEFGFGGFGEAVYHRTYSRTRPDGRQESWHDTVLRVVDGVFSIRRDWYAKQRLPWNESYWQGVAGRMAVAIASMRFLPPGRGLWAMGTDYVYQRGSMALFNCFSGEERLVTRGGVISFATAASLHGGEHQVLTREGWATATVAQFGLQRVQRVTFAPSRRTGGGGSTNHRVVVTVTPNHRWLFARGGETTNLAVGDFVLAQRNRDEVRSAEWVAGFRHGLVFADGSAGYHYIDGDREYRVRLCGAKARFAELFLRRTDPPSFHGDPLVFVRSSDDLKALPRTIDADYIRGFVDGWVAGDGSETKSGSIALSSQDGAAMEWLRGYAALGGYVMVGISVEAAMETNYGPRAAPLQRATLTRDADAVMWRVVSIDPLDEEMPVYCATVPGEASFTLASGVYTGNCGATSVDRLSDDFGWVMDALMCGVGIGVECLPKPYRLQRPSGESVLYVVPDSREGWVESVEVLLRSYEEGSAPVVFDYSLIRPANVPLRGIGGLAAGPDPLLKLHDHIRETCDHYLRGDFGGTRLVADLANHIGCCVVMGNIRRSAEILIGSPDDPEFLDLKDYEKHPEREAWGWMSNNAVRLSESRHFCAMPSIAERIRRNGEPSYMNLVTTQRFGRFGREMPDRATLLNPCGEVVLEPKELCNVSEVFPTRCQTEEEFYEAVELATLYSSTVALLPTHRPETNVVMARNRRIGVSLSGVAEWLADLEGVAQMTRLLRRGYDIVREENRRLAVEAGVPVSIRVTTVKPSGTISQLVGVSSGVHFPTFNYAIRRMRIAAGSPIERALRDAGYVMEPDRDSERTTVVEFPIDQGRARKATEVSVWEQALMLCTMQREWADNAVSVTLYFDPEREGAHLEYLLAQIAPMVKSVSALPHTVEGVYSQAPYSGITREEYERRRDAVRPIDWSVYRGDGQDDRYCSGGICSIPQKSGG